MILKYLFAQYNTSRGPTFGSKFMKACGELVMGTPEQKGLGHLRKDLQESYYYIKEDRHLPIKSLMAWEIQSILVAQYREVEAPQVSRATFLFLLPLIFLCVALASPFNGTLQASVKSSYEGSFLSRFTSSEVEGTETATGSMTMDKCLALQRRLEAKEIDRADIPNFGALQAECTALSRK